MWGQPSPQASRILTFSLHTLIILLLTAHRTCRSNKSHIVETIFGSDLHTVRKAAVANTYFHVFPSRQFVCLVLRLCASACACTSMPELVSSFLRPLALSSEEWTYPSDVYNCCGTREKATRTRPSLWGLMGPSDMHWFLRVVIELPNFKPRTGQ